MPTEKTSLAFKTFKTGRTAKELPAHRVADQDQIKQMTETDGLKMWQDGTAGGGKVGEKDPPTFSSEHLAETMLWAVRESDVPYAPERCPFGEGLESRIVKHSNLTGGGAAYSAGEMLILDDMTIALNGCSGRYGPRSEEELLAVAKAFKDSGYVVWCMGFDTGTGFPLPFVGSTPTRVD